MDDLNVQNNRVKTFSFPLVKFCFDKHGIPYPMVLKFVVIHQLKYFINVHVNTSGPYAFSDNHKILLK